MPPKQVKSKTAASVDRKRSKRGDGDDLTEMGDGTEQDDWMQAKTLVKPEDQLELSEAELKEEFTRILTANNPHAPQNIVRYSFKERQYKQTSSVDQLAVHFALDGNLLHKDSEEAKKQFNRMGLAETKEAEPAEGAEPSAAAAEESGGEGVPEGGAAEGGDEDAALAPATKAGGKEKKLTNQFNFSERASQTYNNPFRDRATVTEPPPRASFSSNVTQWEIYDAYQEDFEKQEKSKEKKVIPGRKEEEKSKKKFQISETSSDDITRVETAAKIVERMVNQNTYDDIAQDFKYWEDVSDEFRDSEGTLLPLWKFSFEKAKKLAITSVCWNPKYRDLVAVSCGSYDFMKQGSGLIILWTMKNPSFPECFFETDSGVMCLDVHPQHPHWICAGFYDGSVAIFSAVDKRDGAIHRCTAKNGKHTDPVWQVRWQKDDADNNMNFYSISSDGRICLWTILKNEMVYQDVIHLSLPDISAEGPDGIKVATTGCGTAFDFHKQKDYLFLVGTEEGKVHICSKAYTSHFIDTIDAHNMAVCWNRFHPKIFITCSADWTVKIWEMKDTMDKSEGADETRKPLFSFDLNNSVGDVAWAPYSSTVFAAVTSDGKAFVYDLNANKYEPLCEQMVAQKKKTKLTHVEFNPTYPIVVIGDDRGNVTSLKLSPNLRKMKAEKKGAPPVDEATKVQREIEKLEKILSMVRNQPTEATA
ncbi:dynein intermediate chain 1, axonemal [Plakobranchus ocellatus]|uniref:Dynein intermediate chain 1, axonemal n=1 Tax=Plakobranchus ocellatus TaxID=259542 RepID=A0AAV4B0F2_9GAST|nr:dynein intermediate chain 1, axonemal [Plakobranchus ocellatus]